MQNQYIIKFEISNEELNQIGDWLKTDLENSKNGRGFYNNWDVILRSFNNQKMAVIKDEESTIGFSIWGVDDSCLTIDIFEIKKEYRKKGIGRRFFEEMSKKFIRDGFVVMRLFCEPKESEKFWKKMGFRKFPDIEYFTQELTYYKPLLEINEPNQKIDHNNKLELWNLEPFQVHDSKPKWTWNINTNLPILNPCNPNWNIRLTKNGEIIKENKIKRFSKEEIEVNAFLYLIDIDKFV